MIRIFFLVVSLSVLLTACGGGGGGSADVNTEPFRVDTVFPLSDVTDADVSTIITVKANNAITAEFADTVSISIKEVVTGIEIEGVVSYANDSFTFTPGRQLREYTSYRITVSSDYGEALFNYSWGIVTGIDDVGPTIEDFSPADQQTDVPVNAEIKVTFSEPIAVWNLGFDDISIVDESGNQLLSDILLDVNQSTFKLLTGSTLPALTKITVSLSSNFRDINGNAISEGFSWSFTTAEDNIPPQIVFNWPSANSTLATDNTIDVQFSETIDESSLDNNSFYVLDGNGDKVPGVITYNNAFNIASFKPDISFVYSSNYSYVVSTAITDLNGIALESGINIPFVTGQDYTWPSMLSSTPAHGDVDVAIDSSIVINFSELMDPTSLIENTVTLRLSNTNTIVPVTAVLDAATLTITPDNSLQYDAAYNLSIFGLTDLAGNPFSSSSSYFSFTTAPLPTFIPIGVRLESIKYSASDNKAYGIDPVNKQLLVIDLTAKQVSKTIQLTYVPNDLCIDSASQTAYIVNIGSTFVSEYDLTTGILNQDIYWPAPMYSSSGSASPHYHIFCSPGLLYVVDGQWGPGLWTINLTDQTYTDHTLSVNGIGNMVFTQDKSEFYTWYQYGWSAGFAGSDVYRYSATDFTNIDQSSLGYPTMSRDPLNSSIFLDEVGGRIFTKRFALNSKNLLQVYYTFPDNIVAADPGRDRVVTETGIYDTTTYNVIASTPMSGDQMFVDSGGMLYIMSNERSKLYYKALP